MAHPRWPGFDEKTGNVEYDNQSRRLNRKLWKGTQQRLRVRTAGGRKRKKQILRVEGANYIQLIVSVANQRVRDCASARHNEQTSIGRTTP
ncbi:hypothetical protein [Curtobacterium sp. MCBD17_040]|uniref:hypothetical protein n=1 Tax=Curtobacterium sp. MCBD17_040 TaxID=2175674 RepID=UPI000DA8A61C|nr:hypothetical protein [Curtobacterium sp. MCBD17_040]WIB65484.1 hypothetical protein DEI94_19110 [Curtobacterium sp. MCBD17_040]